MKKYAALLLLAILPVLTGCGGASGTTSYGGQVTVVSAADRGQPVALVGKDLDGKPVDVAKWRGRPVVVNLWGSWCGPCRAEAPRLVEAAQDLGDRAAFVGIDIRDNPAAAKAFEQNFKITWPSLDSQDGKAVLAFSEAMSVRSPPVTVVLDSQGRVAAYVIGLLPSAQTLVALVQGADGE